MEVAWRPPEPHQLGAGIGRSKERTAKVRSAQTGRAEAGIFEAQRGLVGGGHGKGSRPTARTSNCISLNEKGEMSAVKTTSGLVWKIPGRVNDGIEGWGEAFGFRAVSSAKLAVDELVIPLCMEDVPGVASLRARSAEKATYLRARRAFILRSLRGRHSLWDIAGQAANAPVQQSLGGAS